MTHETQALLLTTVNAPYRNQMDACALATALRNRCVNVGQVSSFLTEIEVETQVAFAIEHDISVETLEQVARVFQDWSGQSVPLASRGAAHSSDQHGPP